MKESPKTPAADPVPAAEPAVSEPTPAAPAAAAAPPEIDQLKDRLLRL